MEASRPAILRHLRNMARNGASPSQMLRELIDRSGLEPADATEWKDS